MKTLAEMKAALETYRDHGLPRKDVLETFTDAISLIEKQQWQPIETAPKDGIQLLLFDGNFDVWAAYWDALKGAWVTDTVKPEIIKTKITHWHYLPQLPQALSPEPEEL